MSTNTTQGLETAIQIGLVAILAIACFIIARPFLGLIVWAGIIAIGVFPLMGILKQNTGLSDGWASFVLTVAFLGVLIVPTTLLTGAIVDNAKDLGIYLKRDDLTIPPPGEGVAELPLIGHQLDKIWQDASDDPKAAIGQYESEIKKVLNGILSALLATGLNVLLFVFSIILAGIFMASAKGATEAIEAVFTRVAGDKGPYLTSIAHDTVQSVVRGILGIAVAQAILAGLGFMAMGVPASGVLALVCLILAIVQIDILIVLIPLSIYMFSDPDTGTVAAVVFLIWNLVVGLMNNVLKPILLGKGVEAPMSVIFIGAIGGMLAAGIVGLFVGAVVMVLGFTLFMYWVRRENEPHSYPADQNPD